MNIPEDSLLPKLEEAIIEQMPHQKNKVKELFAKLDDQMRDMLNTYVSFQLFQGETIEYLAKSYTMLLKETMKEQIYFAKHGCYRYRTFDEVEHKVYQNAAYMKSYMTGLCISTALWENHKQMFRFFLQTLADENKYSGGRYLEIGPGHGFFFMHAMKSTSYCQYDAVDVSQASVNMTKEILEFFQIEKKYTIQCMDFFDMRMNGMYDVITMGEVLEHVERPLRFLKKISEMARPNTHIYISTCINAPEIDHIYLFSDLMEIEALYMDAGLQIKERLVLPYANQSYQDCIAGRLPINVAYTLKKRC